MNYEWKKKHREYFDSVTEYDGISCKELCKRYKNGDKQVLIGILKKVDKRILYAMKRFRLPTDFELSYDDLYNSLVLRVVKAIENYDTSSDANFSTYIGKALFGHVQEELKKYYRDFKSTDYIHAPIENSFDNDDTYEEVIEDKSVDYEGLELKLLVDNAIGKLNEQEQKVICLLWGIGTGNKTKKEVCDLLGITYDQLRRIEERALAKLRNDNDLRSYEYPGRYDDN